MVLSATGHSDRPAASGPVREKDRVFGIHRGSGFGGIPEEILEYQPDAVIADRFTVECQTDNEQTRADFNAFLDGLE